ncbi:MAG: cell division protein ZapE [Pseudomonadota bacterium]
MSPLSRYTQDLERPGFVADPEQRRAVEELERIFDDLNRAAPEPAGLLGFFRKPVANPSVNGLYLWGGVGRGKTYLVDVFHDALPFEQKMRTHFHRFMQRVHAELKTLGGRQDPLQTVADRLSKEARVLCFDEFHVSDITDAMLLGRLLEALFSRGVTLVTTSNIQPDELYKNGLQRQRFLPAIEQLKRNTVVMHLDGREDYRLRTLEQAEIYHAPLDDEAERALAAAFKDLSGRPVEAGDLRVQGRDIAYKACAEGVVWFDFYAVCDGPRGAADYIEIAREFHTVLVSAVPVFGAADNDRAARFITLIDEMYDRSVNVLITAAAAPEALYRAGRHAFAFERTVSRLIEMRSKQYLQRPHNPA